MTLPVAVRRLAYRWGHTALRGWWFVRRPEVEGVKCVLTRGEQVLLVRHTYGRRDWDLPGGAVRRGETPVDCARREMHEELGVDIDAWTELGPVHRVAYHRRDSMHCFQAELDGDVLTVDAGELAAVAWFTPGGLPPDTKSQVREILALAGARAARSAGYAGDGPR